MRSGSIGGVIQQLAVGAERGMTDKGVPGELGDLVPSVLAREEVGEPVAQLQGSDAADPLNAGDLGQPSRWPRRAGVGPEFLRADR